MPCACVQKLVNSKGSQCQPSGPGHDIASAPPGLGFSVKLVHPVTGEPLDYARAAGKSDRVSCKTLLYIKLGLPYADVLP